MRTPQPRCPWPQNCENSKKNNAAFISDKEKQNIVLNFYCAINASELPLFPFTWTFPQGGRGPLPDYSSPPAVEAIPPQLGQTSTLKQEVISKNMYMSEVKSHSTSHSTSHPTSHPTSHLGSKWKLHLCPNIPPSTVQRSSVASHKHLKSLLFPAALITFLMEQVQESCEVMHLDI